MKGLFIALFCHILKQFLNNTLRKSIPAVPKRLCSYFWDTSKLKQRLQYLWYQLLIHVPTLISFSTNRREVTATPSITEENQLYYQQWLSCSQSRCLPWGLAQSYIHCDISFGLFLRKKKISPSANTSANPSVHGVDAWPSDTCIANTLAVAPVQIHYLMEVGRRSKR